MYYITIQLHGAVGQATRKCLLGVGLGVLVGCVADDILISIPVILAPSKRQA